MGRKSKKTRAEIMAKREIMEKIINHMQLKWHEKLRMEIYYYVCRLKVQSISRIVYDTFLTQQSKLFKRVAYRNYAEGKLFKDFGDFHLVMSTRCDINDMDWTKFIDMKGNIKTTYIEYANSIKKGDE
jgi:hypothetical protein